MDGQNQDIPGYVRSVRPTSPGGSKRASNQDLTGLTGLSHGVVRWLGFIQYSIFNSHCCHHFWWCHHPWYCRRNLNGPIARTERDRNLDRSLKPYHHALRRWSSPDLRRSNLTGSGPTLTILRSRKPWSSSESVGSRDFACRPMARDLRSLFFWLALCNASSGLGHAQ